MVSLFHLVGASGCVSLPTASPVPRVKGRIRGIFMKEVKGRLCSAVHSTDAIVETSEMTPNNGRFSQLFSTDGTPCVLEAWT